MAVQTDLESALQENLERLTAGASTPPKLRAAMLHATLAGGARLRPKLCLAVTEACHGHRAAAVPAAHALELLHCASLVHDDLPCFDDAQERRGKPSVHAAFGEAMAVLTGDALIVAAFQNLTQGELPAHHLPQVLQCISDAVSAARGIVGGQAWECEPSVGLARYHRAKTGALFEAACRAGAIVSGHDPDAWADFGARIGEAYQVADDLHDALDVSGLGKPAGQDAAHGRPNAVLSLGLPNALERLERLLDGAFDAIPSCPNPGPINHWLAAVAKRLQPNHVDQGVPASIGSLQKPTVVRVPAAPAAS